MIVCNLASGSKGNSTYVKVNQTEILIDCGLMFSEMIVRLKSIDVNPQNICAILITHEHSDHILGVARFAHAYGSTIYIHSDVWQNMRSKFAGIDTKNIKLFYDDDFYINEITISPVALSHDSCRPVGFSLYAEGIKYSQVTDLGVMTSKILEHISQSHLIMIESNYDVDKLICGSYTPFLKRRIMGSKGHLSNVDCALACKELALVGTDNFILGHLSEENNTEELAFSTTANKLKEIPMRKFSVEIANQYRVGRIYNLRREYE